MPTDAPPDQEATDPFRAREPVDDEVAVEILSSGEIQVLGRMPWTSNATFLVDITHPDTGDEPLLQGVYKPARGERPLPHFPTGLYRREAAASELAHQPGWRRVPPTINRAGPVS